MENKEELEFEIGQLIDKYQYKRGELEQISKKLTDMGFEFNAKEFQIRSLFQEFMDDLHSLY